MNGIVKIIEPKIIANAIGDDPTATYYTKKDEHGNETWAVKPSRKDLAILKKQTIRLARLCGVKSIPKPKTKESKKEANHNEEDSEADNEP